MVEQDYGRWTDTTYSWSDADLIGTHTTTGNDIDGNPIDETGPVCGYLRITSQMLTVFPQVREIMFHTITQHCVQLELDRRPHYELCSKF